MENADRVQRCDAREQRILFQATSSSARVVLDASEREPARHIAVEAGVENKASNA